MLKPEAADMLGSDRDRAGLPFLLHWCVAASLVLAGCSCTAYASCGVWQLGALVDGALDHVFDSSRAGQAAPAVSTRAEALPMPSAALDQTSQALAEREPGLARDVSEASEKPVAVGLTLEQPAAPEPCSDVYVYIVSVVPGAPSLSAASLGLGKAAPARFRQPGQSIGDWEIVSINDDWSGLNPDVWLRRGDSMCRAELAGNPSRVHVALRPPVKPRAARRRGRRRR